MNKIVIILISFSLFNCKNQSKTLWFKDYLNTVENTVNEKFLGNNNEILESEYLAGYPALIPETGVSFIFINPKVKSKKQFNDILKNVKEKANFEYQIQVDSAYTSFIKFVELDKQSIPIPEIYFFKTESKISDSLFYLKNPKVYITDYKRGEFVKNKSFLSDSKVKITDCPHGFTNGVIIDKSLMKTVYYLIVW